MPLEEFPKEGVETLYLGNKLWNSLVELHNEHRDLLEKARCEADKDYALFSKFLNSLEEKITKAFKSKREARDQANTKDPAHPLIKKANEVIDKLKADRGELWESAKKFRQEADKKRDKGALNKLYRDSFNKLLRVENSGLGRKTADLIGDNFKTARQEAFKKGAKLNKHRFQGTGLIFFRFSKDRKQDGVPFDYLFSKGDKDDRPFVFLEKDSSRKKPRLRLRVKMAGGQAKATKVYALFDLILHRPLPENSQIQNAKLNRKRTGDKFTYAISFTVRQPISGKSKIRQKSLGIDIGFRGIKDGTIRVAAIATNDPKDPVEFVDIPKTFLDRINHREKIMSELDDSATELGKIIRPILKSGFDLPKGHWRLGLVEAIARMPNNVTLSFEQAYKLGRLANYERDLLPKKVEEETIRWWTKNSRKYREQHNIRKKSLLDREHFYREVASDLVKRRMPIGIEDINLSTFAETKDADNKLDNTARSQRFLVAPSELLKAIKNAGRREGIPVEKVSAKNTSKTCHSCGYINKKLKSELNWVCPKCNIELDRDHNAAINIARSTGEKLKKNAKDNAS